MPGTTPTGLPYPLPTEPVAEGAAAIRALAEALATVQPWKEIGAAGNPGFENAWINFGPPFATAAFYKDGLGIVHLKGCVKNGLSATNCFTLPAGYRPAAERFFSNPGAVASTSVRPNGFVVAGTANQNASWFLDGVAFRAEL